MSGFLSFKFIGALYSALAVPVVYLRWQSRDKRAENEAFLATHGLVAPESERQKAVSHLLSGDAIRLDSNEHFEGSRNCNAVRKRAAQMARGHVLEVGIGTGEKSVPSLLRNATVSSITGIDIHSIALSVCAEKLLHTGNSLTLVQGRAEALPFPSKSFDTVISQFSLCAIEDPVAAIREMGRVARHKVILLEHGLSYWTVVRWLGFWTSMFPDPQHPWSYGCYQDRDILDIVAQSGLKVKSMKTSSLGHVYLLSLAPLDDHVERDTPEPQVVFRTAAQ